MFLLIIKKIFRHYEIWIFLSVMIFFFTITRIYYQGYEIDEIPIILKDAFRYIIVGFFCIWILDIDFLFQGKFVDCDPNFRKKPFVDKAVDIFYTFPAISFFGIMFYLYMLIKEFKFCVLLNLNYVCFKYNLVLYLFFDKTFIIPFYFTYLSLLFISFSIILWLKRKIILIIIFKFIQNLIYFIVYCPINFLFKLPIFKQLKFLFMFILSILTIISGLPDPEEGEKQQIENMEHNKKYFNCLTDFSRSRQEYLFDSFLLCFLIYINFFFCFFFYFLNFILIYFCKESIILDLNKKYICDLPFFDIYFVFEGSTIIILKQYLTYFIFLFFLCLFLLFFNLYGSDKEYKINKIFAIYPLLLFILYYRVLL